MKTIEQKVLGKLKSLRREYTIYVSKPKKHLSRAGLENRAKGARDIRNKITFLENIIED